MKNEWNISFLNKKKTVFFVLNKLILASFPLKKYFWSDMKLHYHISFNQ